jgi:lanthanide-dependent methanol dehydrogenase
MLFQRRRHQFAVEECVRVSQFIAATSIMLLGALVPAHADKRVALVVGNAAYRHADRLANPVNDARGMRDALTGLGFDVSYGEDLDGQGLRRAIGQFADRVAGADVAIVYFAGHGATFGDTPYVVPVDAEFSSLGQVPYELVPVETLIGELRQAKGVRIAILDACRDNGAEQELKRQSTRGGAVSRGLAPMRNPGGLIIAYATQYLSTAADDAGRAGGLFSWGNSSAKHSPFTAALLNNIATPGLDVKDMFYKVGGEVDAATGGKQRPEISISMYGQYVLVPGTPPVGPPPAGPPPVAAPVSPAGPDAAQAWAAVQSTTSVAMLDEFLRQYGNAPFYGQLARARREELAREQVREPAKPAGGQQTALVDDPCSRQGARCGEPGPIVPPAYSTPTGSLFNSELLKLSKDPNQWVMPAGNYGNQRYSPLRQITTGNVKDLRAAWTFTTGTLRGHEGGPLVVGDVMYLHTPYPDNVYALDLANDGMVLWSYKPTQDPSTIAVMCCDTVNRGLSYGDGKIFLHQADTTLVALDAKTGRVTWSVKNGDPSKGATGTSAPFVIKDKVFVGISGGEFGVQCHLTGYNIKDGSLAWRAYSAGPDDQIKFDAKTTSLGKPVGRDSSLRTWQGDQWKTGGGCTWGWIAYDPDLNLLYYGSGNPSTWNPSQRPGDNKWSASIFARDVDIGVAKWVYQMTPHDEWDFDGTNEMILTDQTVAGQPRKLLTHFDKNGLAYTLDRVTGEPLVAAKYDPAVNWTDGVDMDKSSPAYGRPHVVNAYSPQFHGAEFNTKGICPSSIGAKNQQPAAYSPETRLFYVPATHVCMDYEPFKVSYTAGQPYVGAVLSMYPPHGETNLGNFIAWDGVNGNIVWSDREQFSVWSGALVTAGGVVFYGTLEGYLKAVDAKTGTELFKHKTASGIVGNVMTYERGGKQYVAVLSGVGGWAGIGLAAGLTRPTDGLGAVGAYAALSQYTALGGELTVFALP